LFAALMIYIAAPPQPAFAQNLFEALFGGFRRHMPPPMPRGHSFADPFGYEHRRGGDYSGFGHGTLYCVRTCDGRYFPLQRNAGMSPVETCRSFCPAAKTVVFSGSKIDTAVAQNGTRYADLDTAFAYRDKVVEGCSCKGKNTLGLARLDNAADPTLRAGDIVATADGLAMYNGQNRGAEFTPINTAAGEWARRLSEVKVEPAPPEEKIEPVVNDEPKPARKPRRMQAHR
jgi:hypothetical protein